MKQTARINFIEDQFKGKKNTCLIVVAWYGIQEIVILQHIQGI